MNKQLEETFERVRALPAEDQARAQAALEDVLADADDGMDDPEYRAYVEEALKDVDESADPASYRLASEVFEEMRAKLIAEHDG